MTLLATPREALLAQRTRTPKLLDATGSCWQIDQDGDAPIYSNLATCDNSPLGRLHSIRVIYAGKNLGLMPLTIAERGSGALTETQVTYLIVGQDVGAASVPVHQMVSEIRTAFGLNTTQLAKALKTSRVSIYAWLREDAVTNLQAESMARMQAVYRCSKAWTKRPRIVGAYLQEHIPSLGKSVEQLLLGDELDPGDFMQAYAALLKARNNQVRKQDYQHHQIQQLEKAAQALIDNAEALGVVLD